MKNPLQSSPEVLAEARAHWADHCAGCHGNDGRGQTPIGQSFFPRSPDMRAQRTQQLTDGELYSIIENGIRLTGCPPGGTADLRTTTAGPSSLSFATSPGREPRSWNK